MFLYTNFLKCKRRADLKCQKFPAMNVSVCSGFSPENDPCAKASYWDRITDPQKQSSTCVWGSIEPTLIFLELKSANQKKKKKNQSVYEQTLNY